MSDRVTPSPVHALRAEADATAPAFSESLHTDIMARVNRARREQLASRQHTAPSRRPWFGMAGIVTAVLLGFGVWWMIPDYSTDTPMQISSFVETIQESTSPIQEQFRRPFTVANGQLTLLQHDAETFGQFLADQFDILPVTEDPSL